MVALDIVGPLISSKNSELTVSDSTIQNATHSSATYPLVTLQNTAFHVIGLDVVDIKSTST
jgi:hypothetical protein